MTTERIDHATRASEVDKSAWARGGIDGDTLIRRPEERRDMIASAQVSATLALVEQQRIGNLIALAASAARQVAEGTSSRDDYLRFYAQINDEIREGLGL